MSDESAIAVVTATPPRGLLYSIFDTGKGLALSLAAMVLGIETAVYEPVQTSVAEDEDFSPRGLFRTLRNYTIRPFVHGMSFALGTYIALRVCNRMMGFEPKCLCYAAYLHKTITR